ncbi:MAG: FAD-dependent monooxygenase, partial [Actinomycetota bacterium]|nr:FAD-dependent monooxygenase [Actinomycetota bacterium]
LREDSLGEILARFGDYRGIARGELIEALTPDGCPVTFGTTVTALDVAPAATTATLDTAGTSIELGFDVVIVADGIHSGTRDMLLAGRQADVCDTGWGGWVAWAAADADPDLGSELWGAGHFLGIYPVQGALGVFLGGDRADTAAGPDAFVARVRESLGTTDARFAAALQAVLDDPDRYYWSLTDCRAPTWTSGRGVLLGDAAAGFLPTAGIGAGMAMESAWVLCRMLRHADGDTVPALLRAYERAQRPRVEAAQSNSRWLARMMFHRSTLLAVLREVVLRFTTVEVALGPIRRLLADRPDPDAAAAAFTDRLTR